MPRYFCDYCDVYLTHDSAPGRKQHIRGWKHRENVKQYYEQYMKQFYEQNSGMGMTMPGMAMGSLGALTAGRAPMGLLGMQRPGVAPPLALMGAPGSIPRPPLGYPPRPPMGVPPPLGSIPPPRPPGFPPMGGLPGMFAPARSITSTPSTLNSLSHRLRTGPRCLPDSHLLLGLSHLLLGPCRRGHPSP